MWFGLTTNEVIGYCVMLMFFVLGIMVYLGALVPQWATVEYRNILMAVMFLYGIYRGVTTYAKANQWRRRQAFEAQRDQEEDLN
jgi:Zn-dependent protease with chaperone function